MADFLSLIFQWFDCLQARLFSYSDTQRHRLGPNFNQIPVNRAYNTKVRNYQRDGPYVYDDNQGLCHLNYLKNREVIFS